MKKQTVCEFEPQIVKSLKTGATSDAMTEHLRNCAGCSEAAKIASFFAVNSARELSPKNLPAAGLIWWKSQLREKRRAAARVGQPILIARIVGVILLAAALIWFLTSAVFRESKFAVALDKIFESIAILAVPLSIAFVCFTVICALLTFVLNRLTVEK